MSTVYLVATRGIDAYEVGDAVLVMGVIATTIGAVGGAALSAMTEPLQEPDLDRLDELA